MGKTKNFVKKRKVSVENVSAIGTNSIPVPCIETHPRNGNVSNTTPIRATLTSGTCSLPSCWSEIQRKEFCERNRWLTVNDLNGKLGCTVCAKVSTLGENGGRGMKIAKQWVNNEISYYGDTKEKQQASLRKKIYEHRLTESHRMAEDILNDTIQSQLVMTQCFESSCKLFRTVYALARTNRPLCDLEAVMELQSLNGLDVIETRFRSSKGLDMMRHIEAEMKTKLIERIVVSKCKIAFLIDELSATNVCTLAVYVRFAADEMEEPVNVFLDLVEVPSTNDGTVYEFVLRRLNELGFDEEYLRENLVSIAFDGDATILGRNGGVARLFKLHFPQIVMWHCIAHSLERSVDSAISQANSTNHLKSFVEKLYYLRHISKQFAREFKEHAWTLDAEITKMGGFIEMRRIASSYLTVKSIWENYAALKVIFEQSESDSKRDTTERKLFGSLLKQLTSVSFVQNLGLLYDTLRELAELSLELQSPHADMSCAQNALQMQIRVFECRAVEPGEHECVTDKAVNEMKFLEIDLEAGTDDVEQIDRNRLYECLANELRNRLLDENDDELARSVSVLNPSNWPENVDVLYGEREIQTLCHRMQLEERVVVRGFREYKHNCKQAIPAAIKCVKKCVALIPVSSTECERLLSQMNAICNGLQTTLDIETVSSLWFINSVGLPLSLFDPEPYVRSWIDKEKDMILERTVDHSEESEHDENKSDLWDLLQ